MANKTISKETDSSANYMPPLQPAQSVTISGELFEKLYLNPANKVSGNLRQTFANPTPLPLLGFLIASAPLGAALMGWRGAGGGGAATIGTFYFFGGLLQIIGALLEWIVGNTFIYVVFGSFGAFWLSFAATLTPFYNAEAAFLVDATTPEEKAAALASFQASLAFFLLFIGILAFIYLICSLRTNVVFFILFLFLDIALFLLTGAYWKSAEGDEQAFQTLQKACGACIFVFCIIGFYLLTAQMIRTVDFPFDLPVGDLSGRIPGRKKPENVDANGDAA